MAHRRRARTIALALLVVVIVGLVWAAWPVKSTYTIGPETTYITGPIDRHGQVDYVAALNERLRGDITPQTNGNVLIWQALGPKPEGQEMPPEYFQWLGIDPPPAEGAYLTRYGDHLDKVAHVPAGEQRQQAIARRDRAGRWPWSAAEDPVLADWLERNEKPLALLIAASGRPAYYNPIVPRRTEDWSPGLVMALLPTVQRCREAAHALACRAMLRIHEGKTDEAWRDLLACHGLGRLVARGGTMIELLVGHALNRLATEGDLVLLDRAKLTAAQLRACIKDLNALPPMPGIDEKIERSERFAALDSLQMVARGTTLDSIKDHRPAPQPRRPFVERTFARSIDWGTAFREVNRWYDRCTAAARIADRTERAREMAAITAEMKKLAEDVKDDGAVDRMMAGPSRRGHAVAVVVLGLVFPAFDRLQTSAERVEQSSRNLLVAFALAAYRADHGRYPATLAELAPTYLAAIPDDLFAGMPLIYRPEAAGYLLYSVGPNGADNGGRGEVDEPPSDDVRVRMPLDPPQVDR